MHIGLFWLDQWLKFLNAVEEGLAKTRGMGESERETLSTQVQALRAGTEEAVKELQAERQRTQALQGDLQRLRDASEDERERLAVELAAAREALARAEAARQELGATIEAMKRDNTGHAEERARLLAEQERLGQALATATAECERLTAEIDGLRQTAAAAERDRARLASESDGLRAALAAAQGETAAARQKAAAAEAALAKIGAELSQTEAASAQEINLLRLQVAQLKQAADNERVRAAAHAPRKATGKATKAVDATAAESGIVVHFRKPPGWAEPVYVHYWDPRPAAPTTTWPGTAMTAEGEGWFVHRLPGVEAATLVFNDGTQQTTDLTRDRDGWFDPASHWHDHKPIGPGVVDNGAATPGAGA